MSQQLPRVLLVDDDVSTIQVLRHMLAADFELRYALSGSAALEQVARWHPHLVLLDAQMPEMTGTEVCRRLKADPATARIPVIFVTSLDHTGAELMSIELGAAGVVNKPLDARLLREAIDDALAPASPVLAPAPAAADGRARLLVVDDDPAAIQTVHAALRELDAHFYFATSGQQCLTLARQHRPDLVLLDMYMPGLDGLSTLKALTSDASLADTQVAIITRFAYPEMETRALEAGGVDFIAKPYTHAVLKARVGNLLRLREQKAQARAAEREHWQRIGNVRLARVVAAASDAIITADAKGRIVLINAAACSLFGVDAAQTIGQPLGAMLPALSPSLALHADLALARQRLELDLPGGRVAVAASVSRLAKGDEQLTTVVLHDLTEHERAMTAERAKAEAEAALRSKTMMLSYIAHEVGNPLASIIGLTNLLKDGEDGMLAHRRTQLLQYMNESGEHLKSLMSDLLDLQRVESGRFELALRPVDAAACLRRAASSQAAEALSAGVNIEPTADGAPLHVMADDTRLLQCLVNLVSNAVKYNRTGGHVRLRLIADATQVCFEVEDDGLGMSAEQLEHLFEPFNRLGRTAVRGTGIGLALTRMLVLAMAGSLRVSSTLGQGSLFTLALPRAPSA